MKNRAWPGNGLNAENSLIGILASADSIIGDSAKAQIIYGSAITHFQFDQGTNVTLLVVRPFYR